MDRHIAGTEDDIDNTTTTTEEDTAMTNNSLTTLLDNYSLADIAYGAEQRYNYTCTADDVTSKGISVAHEGGKSGWLTDEQIDDLLAAMPNLRSADDNY